MLSPQDRRELRALLEAEIEKLDRSLVELRERSKPVAPDNAIGRLTRMDSLVHQSTAQHLLQKTEQRLDLLRHRLDAIDDERFGVCPRCKKPIALERLRAVPDAIFCIACAQAR